MSSPDPLTTGIVLAGALQLAKQAEDFIAAVAGCKGETLGTIFGDLTHRRLRNVEGVGSKAHFTLLNIGVIPGEIPLNVWHPLLEGASLQEDDELQERWANLLANAADPRKRNPVEPAFIAMLKDLSPREVKFLDALFKATKGIRRLQMNLVGLHIQYREANLTRNPAPPTMAHYSQPQVLDSEDEREFGIMVDILTRGRILAESVDQRDGPYCFTNLGFAFVRACQRPQR